MYYFSDFCPICSDIEIIVYQELRPQKSVFVDPSTQRTGNTAKANLLEVSKLNTPSPGETLAMFYARTRECYLGQ